MVKQATIQEREAIVNAKLSGQSHRQVAAQFGVSPMAVSRIFKKFEETDSVERKAGSGKPFKTTAKERRRMVKIVKEDPKKTATEVFKFAKENMDLNISVETARRILRSAKLFGRRPCKKPLISLKNRKARLAFAKRHLAWTKNEWGKILWSDESKFNLFSSDGIRYIRRPVGERFNRRYQVPTVKHGGGNVMIWGKMSFFLSLVI